MRYISTNGKSTAELNEAVVHCFAPDGGLYLPESISRLPRAYFNNIQEMNLREIAYVVVTTLMGAQVEAARLKAVVDGTFSFPLPLRPLRHCLDVLELFDGPTLAFKDISAKFIAELVSRSVPSGGKHRVGLVATTGNTGAAIANAFAHNKDQHVVVLFPRGALSRSQQAQFTTLGANIHAVEVSGSICQCKQMVRDAVDDPELARLSLPICLNTHNILRIIPQVVFFFHAYSRLKARGEAADGFTVAIPCANLSNLVAAVIAKRMGLPIGRIVAGCTSNDDLVRVVSGELPPGRVNTSSRPTLARAMDAGYPTNIGRLLALYGGSLDDLRRDIVAVSVSDMEISRTINDELARSGYMADPHTAVALRALELSGVDRAAPAVVLATAHPAKSLDTMTAVTGRAIELPLQLTRFMARGAQPVKMPPTYHALRKYLMNINP